MQGWKGRHGWGSVGWCRQGGHSDGRHQGEPPTWSKDNHLPDSPTDGAAGAPEEFIEAYRTYAPAVLGYLRSRAVEDPEAVMQDVFVAVLPRMGAVAGGA